MYCIVLLFSEKKRIRVVEKERAEKNKDCRRLYKQIVDAIEPMYKSTWVNIRMHWLNLMALWWILFASIEWYVYSFLICSVMNLFQCCVYVWFHDWMYEVFERERMSFNCFSSWEILQGMQWNFTKCTLTGYEFYLRKAQERYRCSHTSRSVSIAQSHARSVQVGWSLILFQPKRGVEGFMLQGLHTRGGRQITRGYRECH